MAVFAPGARQDGETALGVFEGFATTTDATGHYQLQLPPGDHVVAASDANDAVIAATSIRAAATQSLDLTLQAAMMPGEITGALVGSGFGVSATGNVPWNSSTYTVVAGGVTLGSGPLIPSPDVSPGTGSLFQIAVAGGQSVSVTLLPAPGTPQDPCLEYPPFATPPVAGDRGAGDQPGTGDLAQQRRTRGQWHRSVRRCRPGGRWHLQWYDWRRWREHSGEHDGWRRGQLERDRERWDDRWLQWRDDWWRPG